MVYDDRVCNEDSPWLSAPADGLAVPVRMPSARRAGNTLYYTGTKHKPKYILLTMHVLEHGPLYERARCG